MFAVRIEVPSQRIIEIQDDGDDMLTVTSGSGETYELHADAFLVLTGRDWIECVDEIERGS